MSFTAACGGSPTRPTAANPALGGGTSATSVKLTTFQQDGAVDQICTAQSVTYDDGGNLIPDVSTTTDTPANFAPALVFVGAFALIGIASYVFLVGTIERIAD